MSDTGMDEHPPARLVRYVEAMLAPGQSIRAFCAERPGLDAARISAWRSAKDVSIEHMRDFGAALGLSLGQVMVIAGYGTVEEFGEGAVPPVPVPPPTPSVAVAIEADPALTDDERQAMRTILGLVRKTKETGRSARTVIKRKA